MPIIGNFGGGSSKVDKTLLMEGVAADAKATGEAIEAVKTMYVTAEFGEEIASSGASSLHTLVNVSSTPEEIINAHKNGVRVVLEHPDAGCFDVTMIDEDKLRVLFQGTYDSAELQITLRYSGDAVMCSVTKMDLQYMISGTEGQIVGFNGNGYATAQDFPQSDLNENDETAAGYVKNRTHWTETIKTITYTGAGYNYVDLFPNMGASVEDIIFAENKAISLDLDGTIYNGVTKLWSMTNESGSFSAYYFGNASILADLIGMEAPEGNTGETYFIDLNPDAPSIIFSDETVQLIKQVTVCVDVESATANYKIPDKYLPTERFIIPGTGKYSEIFNGNYYDSIASGDFSHAEGISVTASGSGSHAEGNNTTASGEHSHAEGSNTTASGRWSHVEGFYAVASGEASHAEGNDTTASGEYSHAEGYITVASGSRSHAEGNNTTASTKSQHVQGEHNIVDTEGDADTRGAYAHIVGNGDYNARSNAHTLDWDGNAWFAGDVYVGSTSGTNKDEGSKKLITQEYVDIRVPAWTEADEGKVLKIVNGVPTWVNISVTSTDDGDGNVVIS